MKEWLLSVYHRFFTAFYRLSGQTLHGWKIRYSSKTGLTLLLNLDHYIDFIIYRRGVYTKEIIRRLPEWVRAYQPAAFIDVGSNLGEISLFVARHYPGVRVFSFEAHPELHAQQRMNMILNHLSYDLHQNVVTEVSDKQYALHLPSSAISRHHYGKANYGMFSIFPEEDSTAGSFLVPSITLSQFFQDSWPLFTGKTLLIKLDVEGAELSVLKGMQLILEKRDTGIILILEMLFEKHLHECLEILRILTENDFFISDLKGNPFLPEDSPRKDMDLLAIRQI